MAEVVTEGQATITTQRGNEVSKNAEPNDPAIAIERSGNDVVKKAHEVDVEQPGDKHKEDHGEEKATEEDKKGANGDAQKAADGDKEANGEAQTGEKRKAEEPAEDQKEEESVAKKQKTDDEPEENGDKPAPKKKGRPAKNANGEAKSKETKKVFFEFALRSAVCLRS